MEKQGQSRSQTLSVMSVVLLFLVQILLVAPASGVLVGVDGNEFVSINYTNSNKTILCTSVSQSHCDTDHSVVIGRNNYDNGAVAARFEFEVPKAQCMEDEEFEVRMNIQLNGPNGERGWGSAMNSDDQNYVAVGMRDYGQSSVVYDIADATASYKYFPERPGKYGSIGTTDDNTNFRNITIGPIPANGTIGMTYEEGLYLSDVDPTTELSEVNVSILNHPYNTVFTGSDNMRTEIEWIGIEYQDETNAPTNPSGPVFSSSTQYSQIFPGTGVWTQTRVFDITFVGSSAADMCSSASLEFDFVPANTNQQPVTTWTSTSAAGKNNLWIPPPNGEYELHYRAIDENGNAASWQQVSGLFKLDRIKPIISSNMNSPQGWYSLSGNNMPSVSWNEWSDNLSGMAAYTLRVPGSSWSHSVLSQNNPFSTYTWNPTTSDINFFSNSSFCKANTFQLTGKDNTTPIPNERSTTFTVNIDTCKPVISQIIQPNGNWYTTNTPTLYFNAPSDGQGSGIGTCTLLVPGLVNYSIPVSTCTGQNPAQSIYLPDGIHYVDLEVCDLVSNCNTSTTIISVDSSAPVVLTSSSSTHLNGLWSNQNVVNLSVSFSDVSTGANSTSSNLERVWLKVASSTTPMSVNQIKAGNTTACNSSLTCTIGTSHTLLSGGYSVYVVAEDNAGNQLHQVLNLTIAIDVDSPTQNTPSFNQTLSSSNTTTVSWQASIDSHSGVDYYVVNLSDLDRNATTTQVVQSTSVQFSDLLEGNYSACVKTLDNVGLQSANICTPQQLRIDSSAPSLTSTVNVTGWANNTSSVRLTWNSSDAFSSTTMRYSLNSNPYSSLYPSNGTIVVPQLPNGWHTIQVLVQDAAGNSIISSHQFGIDRIAPSTNFSSTQAGGWTNAEQQLIVWSISDNVAGSGIALAQLVINSGDPVNISSSGQKFLNLPTGVHSVQLRALDLAGNLRISNMTFRIDTSLPIAQCSILPTQWTNGLLNVDVAPSGNGSISPFYWTLNVNGVEDSTATVGLNSYNLANGIHVFTLAAWNTAGGQSSCQVLGSVDKSNPVIVSTSLLPTHMNESTLSFTIQASDVGPSGLESFTANIGPTTLGQGLYTNGQYTLNLSNFTDGTHELLFTIYDQAGNTVQLTHSFIMDRESPDITQFQITNSTANGWFYERDIEVLWGAYDELDSTLDATIYLNEQPIVAAFSTSPKSIQLPVGNHTLTLRVVDDSGNVAYMSMGVSVDFHVPNCEFTNSLDNLWSSDDAVTISSSCVQSPSNVSMTYSLNGGPHTPLNGVKTFGLVHGTNNLKILAESGSALSTEYTFEFLSDQYDPTVWAELESADTSDAYADGRIRLNFSAPFDGASPLSYHIYLNDQLESEAYGFGGGFNQSYEFVDLQQGSYEIRIEVSDETGRAVTKIFDEVYVNLDVSPLNLSCKFGDNSTVFAIDSSQPQVVIGSMELANSRVNCEVSDGFSMVNLPNGIGTIVSVNVNENPELVNLVQEDPTHFTFRMSPLTGNDYIGWINLDIVTVDRWGNLGNHSFDFFVKHSVQNINSYTALNVEMNSLHPQQVQHEFLIIGLHETENPVVSVAARVFGRLDWNISLSDYDFEPVQGEPGKHLLSFSVPGDILIGHTASEPLVYEVYIHAMDDVAGNFSGVFELTIDGCKENGLLLDIPLSGLISCQPVRYVGPTLATEPIELAHGNTQTLRRLTLPELVNDLRPAEESCHVFEKIGEFNIEIIEDSVSIYEIGTDGSFTIQCIDLHGLSESYTVPIQLIQEERRETQSSNQDLRRLLDMAIGAGSTLIVGLLIAGIVLYTNSKSMEEEE